MITINRPLPFVLASSNVGMMITNHLDTHKAQYANTHFGVGHQILHHGCHDTQEVHFCLQLLHLRRQYFGNGVVGLDCGANVGVHSVAWGIEMSGDSMVNANANLDSSVAWGEVIGFEAQERIYYAFAGNVALNNCFNVKAVFAALGNPKKNQKDLEIPLVDYCKPSSFGSLELKKRENTEFIGQEIDYSRTQKVPFISIDSLHLSRVDLIKIDVEGMEKEVLEGAMQTIKKCSPILHIEMIKSNIDEILSFLNTLDYRHFAAGINMLAIHKDDPSLKHININSSDNNAPSGISGGGSNNI